MENHRCFGSRSQRDHTIRVLLSEHDGSIWLDDKAFWPCSVNQQNSHRAIRIESADGSVDFITKQQASMLIEGQVIGAPDSSQQNMSSVVCRGCACGGRPGGSSGCSCSTTVALVWRYRKVGTWSGSEN